jgi:hypothetical protein
MHNMSPTITPVSALDICPGATTQMAHTVIGETSHKQLLEAAEMPEAGRSGSADDTRFARRCGAR